MELVLVYFGARAQTREDLSARPMETGSIHLWNLTGLWQPSQSSAGHVPGASAEKRKDRAMINDTHTTAGLCSSAGWALGQLGRLGLNWDNWG